MKVIEGAFGKSKRPDLKASDMYQALADSCSELEDTDNADIKTVCVMFVEGSSLQILSNDVYPDSAYMLLSMGKDSIMSDVLNGGAED